MELPGGFLGSAGRKEVLKLPFWSHSGDDDKRLLVRAENGGAEAPAPPAPALAHLFQYPQVGAYLHGLQFVSTKQTEQQVSKILLDSRIGLDFKLTNMARLMNAGVAQALPADGAAEPEAGHPLQRLGLPLDQCRRVLDAVTKRAKLAIKLVADSDKEEEQVIDYYRRERAPRQPKAGATAEALDKVRLSRVSSVGRLALVAAARPRCPEETEWRRSPHRRRRRHPSRPRSSSRPCSATSLTRRPVASAATSPLTRSRSAWTATTSRRALASPRPSGSGPRADLLWRRARWA